MQLRDLLTEARLFGALLFEPDALGWCDSTEPDDFSNLHLRFAFWAMRNIEARGEAVDFAAVSSELARTGYAQIDLDHVAETSLEPAYNFQSLVEIDARWLRRLARRRANV